MGGGPPEFTPDSTCPALLGWLPGASFSFAYWTVTVYGPSFQNGSAREGVSNSAAGLQPGLATQAFMRPVWAGSRSLAATKEVEVSFFSSGY